MNLDIKTVDERLAKAKEDAAFWEKARSVLDDPRMRAILGQQAPSGEVEPRTLAARPMPRAYGSLKHNVLAALPGPDADMSQRVTTRQIVATLETKGFVFTAADKEVAVNGALVALKDQGLAEWSGRMGNAKLWRRKVRSMQPRDPNQEAPEGAS